MDQPLTFNLHHLGNKNIYRNKGKKKKKKKKKKVRTRAKI